MSIVSYKKNNEKGAKYYQQQKTQNRSTLIQNPPIMKRMTLSIIFLTNNEIVTPSGRISTWGYALSSTYKANNVFYGKLGMRWKAPKTSILTNRVEKEGQTLILFYNYIYPFRRRRGTRNNLLNMPHFKKNGYTNTSLINITFFSIRSLPSLFWTFFSIYPTFVLWHGFE